MSNRFRTENPSWCFYQWWVHALKAGHSSPASTVSQPWTRPDARRSGCEADRW
jgi:hypothetical protein